ncbi:hypothetical protein RQP46_010858 [Phenoliferia psychrophenolica]
MMSIRRPVASRSSHLLTFLRSHSSSSTQPAFAPIGSTSAQTEIPYGEPALASSAYLPHRGPPASASPNRATSESPQLSARQRDILEKIVRVDQAGEVGANWIYAGQHAVLSKGKDRRVADLVQGMWDGEKKHIAVFDKLVAQHGVRPTMLYPAWKLMGFALGAGTALMGKRAAMACTEAVETAIGEHYDSQVRALSNEADFPTADLHPSIALLRGIVAEFRDDELGHLDTAIQNDSQLAPAHALLSAVIGVGCKAAIAVTERVAPSPAHAPLLIGKVKNALRPGVKNILVTGGAGFIGSWVVRHLVVQYPEYNIVCFDKLDYCATLNNLAPVNQRRNYTFHHGDITLPDDITAALKKYDIDTVMHFAAQSHVDLSFGNSYSFTHANVFGTHVLLESAKAHDVKLFIHVSTDEVYGEVGDDEPDLLETAILAPTNPYAASKAAAEMLVNAYYKSFKLPVIIVRSNNVYGPHQYPEKIIPKFSSLLNRGEKLIIHGDGKPTRRYLYGGDAADAFDFVLSKGIVGQIYNVGSAAEISNLDLCKLLLAEFDRPVSTTAELGAEIVFVRDRPFNDHRYAVDGSKLKKLGWTQNTPFDEGLSRTVEWYQTYGETWWGNLTPVLTAFPEAVQGLDGKSQLQASANAH